MSNYIRIENIDEDFFSLHGIKPQVYQLRENGNNLKSKLIYGGKEIVLHETLDKGLTKDVILSYNNQDERFESVYKAEQRAADILRS